MEIRRLELYHAEVTILGTRQTCNLIATVMDPLAMFLWQLSVLMCIKNVVKDKSIDIDLSNSFPKSTSLQETNITNW